jgi:hypothetical protein
VLPEDALLEIFDFYLDETQIEAWQTLVHVCQKWRNIVLGSPRRLNLRLDCTARTPVRKMLDIWPPLPIVIRASGNEVSGVVEGVDNIIAAFNHNDRISAINIGYIRSENILAEMERPFLALQALTLKCILFPGLPNLLLSATHLVHLVLREIPFFGLMSPDAMVTCLSVLTRLDELVIEFGCRQRLKSQRSPPPTRTLLPVLTKLRFRVLNEYLEDLVARIDAPLLDNLEITFFYHRNLDTSQLTQFVSRIPKFKTYGEARLVLSDYDISVTLPQTSDGALELKLGILSRRPDLGLSSLAEVCSSSFPLISAVEHLYIISCGIRADLWVVQDDIVWPNFFQVFTAVKDLYILSVFMPRIAPALQELTPDGVLPALRTLYLEDPTGFQEATTQFITARQLAGHPIAITRRKTKIEDS